MRRKVDFEAKLLVAGHIVISNGTRLVRPYSTKDTRTRNLRGAGRVELNLTSPLRSQNMSCLLLVVFLNAGMLECSTLLVASVGTFKLSFDFLCHSCQNYC